jgi:superfamily II DNA or RNA helicase
LDLSTVATGADGDFVRGQLALKTRESNITGHVVEHYLRITPGKLGITFAPDVETATLWSAEFNKAGVPCEVITAKTPDRARIEIMKRFARRELLMLTNQDILGEGIDVPAVEVVIMGRATESYSLYVQQFCRMDRLMDGKKVGFVIDHVNNVLRHGLPDRPREWSLERKERRTANKDPDVIPMRTCANPECLWPYERFLSQCPYCGMVPVPAERSTPDQVDGVLEELDPSTLAVMRGEKERIDADPQYVFNQMIRMGQPEVVAFAARNRHRERQVAQAFMREAAQLWMGYQASMGRDIAEAQRRFYHRFKTDVLSAQALGRSDADEMTQLLCNDIVRLDTELRTGATTGGARR